MDHTRTKQLEWITSTLLVLVAAGYLVLFTILNGNDYWLAQGTIVLLLVGCGFAGVALPVIAFRNRWATGIALMLLLFALATGFLWHLVVYGEASGGSSPLHKPDSLMQLVSLSRWPIILSFAGLLLVAIRGYIAAMALND